jgi:hypothetical protein
MCKMKNVITRILTIHVSYASSYFALLQCNLVEHLIMHICEDLDILRFFQHWEYPLQVTSNHWDCIQQWFKRYSWKENRLVRCLPQGDKVVPPPHKRHGLIQKVHLELRHFEIKRTYSLFALHYHWKGMYAQVRHVIA